MDKEYARRLHMTLRSNQITLFGLDGREKTLDRETHIYDDIVEFDWDWGSKEQKVAGVLQLTLDVWASWEIHIKNSSYSLPHFGGVHAEEDWLSSGTGSPPCIILLNQPIAQPNEQLGTLPVQVEWKCAGVLGPIETYSFVFDNCGKPCRAWRIYLANAT